MIVDNQPLISVVVPVYNTEKYLVKCIESLINQTLGNIEIILVDDGSTDASFDILNKYKNKDPRVQVLTQKNQFAGTARNNGMDHAVGKYIIFLDSDDFFEPDMLEKMYNAAEESGADITICGYREFDDESGEEGRVFTFGKGCFVSSDFGNNCLSKFSAAPWDKLYNRNFISEEKLRFQAIKNTNDTYFTRVAGVIAKRITVIDDILVHYRVNNKKSLQGSFLKKKLCFGDALIAIKKELEKRKLYAGEIEESFCKESYEIINYYLLRADSEESENQIYDYCLKLLSVLSFPKEFERYFDDCIRMQSLFKGLSYTDYLYLDRDSIKKKMMEYKDRIITLKNNSVSKNSFTYKIGNAFMFVPKSIHKVIKRCKK